MELISYSGMVALGAVAGMAALLIVNLRSRDTFPVSSIVLSYIYVLFGTFAGARCMYALVTSLSGQGSFFGLLLYGGYVFYGGLIGSVLCVALYCFLFTKPLLKTFDMLICAAPIAQAFGRVGCFVSGCCYGIPMAEPWGIVLLNPPGELRNVPLLPVQLIESACCLCIFAALLAFRRKERPDGGVFAMYLLLYGVVLFILEFFRYDSIRGIWGALSTSQWISLAAVAVGLFLTFIYPRIKIKNKRP